ncbi:hypothetical protein AB0M35_27555 [Micromonospora sp. NPDC051196]|uniref:hypothetical protein n=1 Tax=Micromonospora sp. NPDC051196 TaxID=3155281 RepID=UPI0034327312
MDLSSWGGSEWQAVAAFIAIFVAGPIALWQVLEARRVRLEQSRPYVIVDFEFRSILVYLKIENIGTTIARNVEIKFDPPLESASGRRERIRESSLFRQPIPMLAPGRKIAIRLDSYNTRASSGLPMQYTVSISYEGVGSQKQFIDPPYPLDLKMYEGASVEPRGLPDLVREVEGIRSEIRKWTSGISGLLIHNVDADQRERRMVRAVLQEEAANVRREKGIGAYIRWHADRQLRRRGWKR